MQHTTGHYERTRPKVPPTAPPSVKAEIAALTRLIKDHEREVSRLKRQRKSLVMREHMRTKRKTPEFQAAMTAGIRAGWKDPAKAEKWRVHARKGGSSPAKALPPMTDEQRKFYVKLCYRNYLPRKQALEQVFA